MRSPARPQAVRAVPRPVYLGQYTPYTGLFNFAAPLPATVYLVIMIVYLCVEVTIYVWESLFHVCESTTPTINNN